MHNIALKLPPVFLPADGGFSWSLLTVRWRGAQENTYSYGWQVSSEKAKKRKASTLITATTRDTATSESQLLPSPYVSLNWPNNSDTILTNPIKKSWGAK